MLRSRLVAILCLLASPFHLNAQNKTPDLGQPRSDQVVRITTQLVQTDVVVLDKNGEFVEGLKPEEFEVRINGKPRQVLFFERLTAGTANEEVQMAAARGRSLSGGRVAVSSALDRGRTILFYLDDYHLSANSIVHAREMLMHFIESGMGPHDELGIFTGTGQLGFLEQFTNEKPVLRRAVEKLKHRSFQAVDAERPPMSETEAIAIMNGDSRILDYFEEQRLRDLGQPRPRQPSPVTRSRGDGSPVRARAKSIVDQVAALTNASLNGFDKTLRSAGQLPWQKLAFFISDGFQMIEGNNPNTALLRIADAASHSATVIYSIDARGLISGAPEASRKLPFDYTGRLASVGTRAINASQEPLRTLALEAGGLPILDTNDPLKDLRRAVTETSTYYQVAWRPQEEELRDPEFQIVKVTLPRRPDLTVRVRHGFFFTQDVKTQVTGRKQSQPKKGNGSKKEQEAPLAKELRSNFARRELPVSVSAGYIDTGGSDLLLTASLEVAREALALEVGTENMQFDLAGVVVDESGRPVATFEENLTVTPSEILSSSSRRVVYNHQLRVLPGLYQVRVALEEKKSGRIGSARQWLDIPNPRSGNLLLSSLFLGEVDAQTLSSGKLNVNANHRFPLRSRLGFMMYVYNATPGSTGPDVAIQVIVIREDQPVLTRPLIKVDTNGLLDAVRIPYGEDFELGDLPAGRYVLQINAIDRIAKKSASQQTRFSVH